MKLRLILKDGQKVLCCKNGSLMYADDKVLERLLTEFKKPSSFKGTDGCWNILTSDMEEVSGQDLAIVDDNLNLVILSPLAFSSFSTNDEYVSASEYAEIHGKSHPLIKRLCKEGRIVGAKKIRSCWVIPKDAPYPELKARGRKKKSE